MQTINSVRNLSGGSDTVQSTLSNKEKIYNVTPQKFHQRLEVKQKKLTNPVLLSPDLISDFSLRIVQMILPVLRSCDRLAVHTRNYWRMIAPKMISTYRFIRQEVLQNLHALYSSLNANELICNVDLYLHTHKWESFAVAWCYSRELYGHHIL